MSVFQALLEEAVRQSGIYLHQGSVRERLEWIISHWDSVRSAFLQSAWLDASLNNTDAEMLFLYTGLPEGNQLVMADFFHFQLMMRLVQEVQVILGAD
jgi:hypothetical protein